MTQRLRIGLGLGLSLLLLLGALFLPTGWYDALPRSPRTEQAPIRGTTLLRLIFALQAIVVAVIALRGWRWTSMPAALRMRQWEPRVELDDLSETLARRGLTLITLAALALRLYGLGADLWLDELLTLQGFVPLSVGEIIGSYRSPNNHLLNSLLIKASVALFGEHAWSIRLSTALFGVATIPALYRVARLAMSRRSSLGAALLLAVSYHHVFFSQNARGFVPYIFFALVAARAMIDGFRDQRLGSWVLFGVATFFGFNALLNSAFVMAAELIVAVMVVIQLRAEGSAVAPLVRRLALVFAVTSLCAFSVYAVALPDAYMMITRAYKMSGTGSPAGSNELVNVVVRGIADGFGPQALVAAVPFVVLALGGLLILWRRQWAVTALLLFPGVLTTVVLASRGMTFSPRHFLLWLPLAVLTAVVTIDALSHRVRSVAPRAQHTLATVIIALIASVSALSLRRYYSVPKQPYSTTVRYLERTRASDELVFAIHPSWTGLAYYAEQERLPSTRRYVRIMSVATLDSALAQRGGRGVRLVTTLESVSNKSHQALMDRVRLGWQRDTTFAATVGDGELSVWSERTDSLTRAPGAR